VRIIPGPLDVSHFVLGDITRSSMTTHRMWVALIKCAGLSHSMALGTTSVFDKRPSRRLSSNLYHLSGTGLKRRFSEPDSNVNHPSCRACETYPGMVPVTPGVERNLASAEAGLCVPPEGKVSQTLQDRRPASLISRNVIRHNLPNAESPRNLSAAGRRFER
jgi:hypothetical protein